MSGSAEPPSHDSKDGQPKTEGQTSSPDQEHDIEDGKKDLREARGKEDLREAKDKRDKKDLGGAPGKKDLEETEDNLGEPEDRGYDERIVTRTVWAKNNFDHSNIRIEGNFIVGADERPDERGMVPVVNVTRSVELSQKTFVAPDVFGELLTVIGSKRMVLMIGTHCGKQTAGSVALARAGHTPILLMPAGVSARALLDGIERTCSRSAKAGVLIESVDAKTLSELAGFELQRLKGVVSKGAAIVLTAHFAQEPSAHPIDIPIVKCSSPPLQQIIEKASAPARARESALAALGLLEEDQQTMSPSGALALLDAAGDAEKSPEQLAREFAGSATAGALDNWLASEQPAKHLASLAAGVALVGAPSVDIDLAAEELAGLLAGDEPEDDADVAKTFRLVDRGWPNDILTVTHRAFSTHFGSHETEVVEICPPHTRQGVIAYLWRALGPDFRHPFVLWLRDLATNGSQRIRFGAAVTAGVLFVEDPIIAERELLRPWALDPRRSQRACAAVALGVPVAIGADPTAARRLTREWGTSANVYLRHVAVLAYGGLLGACDPGSAAPVHLWRIGTETDELERAADISLASLVAAGGKAGWVRATVLGVLDSQAGLRPVPMRVYRLLPLLFRHLTATSQSARESLSALLEDPGEHGSAAVLAMLMVSAFDSPSGQGSARAALDVLLKAMADSRIEEQAVFEIVREMKAAAKARDGLGALRDQLERALWMQARRHGPVSEAARLVLAKFFPSN